ncbi:reverse transcriptase domain-containing protein [Tanacetum coccineum]
MRIEESLNVTFDESFPEPKLSPLVEDDRINEPVVQNLVRSPSLEVNASEPGYPKSVKEARGHPIEQVIEENFEEEVVEIMAKTMEEYMSKTQADYGSGVTRAKIDDKDHFELKGQFLKELRDNTFSGAASHWLRNKPSGSIKTCEDIKVKILSEYCTPARTTKKMEEINNFQQEPDETLYQAWERFKELLMKFPQHYLTKMQELLMQKYLSKRWLNILNNGTTEHLRQEVIKLLMDWLYDVSYVKDPTTPKTVHLKKKVKPLKKHIILNLVYLSNKEGNIEQQLQDSIKGIMQTIHAAIRNQGALIKTLEIQIGKMSKEKDPGSFTLPCYINNVYFENALAELGASVSVMPFSTCLNLGLGELAHTKLTIELADRTVKHPNGITKNVLVGIDKFIFLVDFIILDMPEDVKVPMILGRPFLSTAHTKINVFKRKITLRVGEEKIIFKSVKPTSSLIKRVYMLSLRERMELDLEARLMGETLVLNRLLDPLYGDYIELNDLNVPLELRRDQVDDLMPTIEEGEVVDKPMIEEVKTRNDNKMVSKIIGYPSGYDKDEKIRIGYAYNLKFSCMIGFKFVHANFFPNLPINVMSKKFYNSIIKDKIEFRGRNEFGNFANVLVFIGNFYVITNFTVVEDKDPYLDEETGEVVVGEPFCEVSCVETRRFDGVTSRIL